MSDNTVLGSLPKTRPHRRSDKREPTPAVSARADHHGQSAGDPAEPGQELISATLQAAAELATIGISASARALRAAVSRLPR